MSRKIDLTKPLSDEDREYLEARDMHVELDFNRRHTAGEFEGKEVPPGSGHTTHEAMRSTAAQRTDEGETVPVPPPGAELTPEQRKAATVTSRPEEEDDYEDWTVDELKEELTDRKVEFDRNDRKAALIKKLQDDDKKASE